MEITIFTIYIIFSHILMGGVCLMELHSPRDKDSRGMWIASLIYVICTLAIAFNIL